MFRWLNKTGVESDKGFVVQRTSRYKMLYREGEQRMFLDVESGAAGTIHVQMPREFWDFPYTGQQIPSEKLDEIRSNITEALRFQRLETKFDAQ